jgi:hypothetical protein
MAGGKRVTEDGMSAKGILGLRWFGFWLGWRAARFLGVPSRSLYFICYAPAYLPLNRLQIASGTGFFQIGTSRLSSSMSHWQAAKASARWGAATSTQSEGSPALITPTR